MIDKSNIKTTDWLTKGMTDEQIQKEKAKAIRQADKEFARIKKKERKKSMRAYRKMYRRHRKELIDLAKKDRDWDYGWLDEFVLMKIKHMHEYFSAGANVWQTDETRIPIVDQLKHVLDLYDELDHLWDDHIREHVKNEDGSISSTEASANSYIEKKNREQGLYEEIYSYVGKYIQWWWD